MQLSPVTDFETATLVNTYELGSLSVAKTVTSDAEDAYGNPIVYRPFHVSVSCEFLGEKVWARRLHRGPDGARVLGGRRASGAERTAGRGGGHLTESVQLTATNTFDVGSITVNKEVVGEGPDSFEVELACTYDVDGVQTTVDIPGGSTRTIDSSGNFTATYADLPVGAEHAGGDR